MANFPRDEIHEEFNSNKADRIAAYSKAVTGDGSHVDPWVPLYGQGVNNLISNQVSGITSTPMQLTPSELIQGVEIKAHLGNDGNTYIGGTGLTTDIGYALAATETVFIRIDNVDQVYLTADETGNRVFYMGS